eukprot:27121_4
MKSRSASMSTLLRTKSSREKNVSSKRAKPLGQPEANKSKFLRAPKAHWARAEPHHPCYPTPHTLVTHLSDRQCCQRPSIHVPLHFFVLLQQSCNQRHSHKLQIHSLMWCAMWYERGRARLATAARLGVMFRRLHKSLRPHVPHLLPTAPILCPPPSRQQHL